MFQVVVEVFGEATAVVVMVIPSFRGSKRLSIDIISIDIDISDGDYNDRDSDSYGQAKGGSGDHPRLVGHAEGVAVDRPLSSSHNERGGLRGIGLSSPGSTATQGAMPVNAIGPKVDLNPGSVSVAVDRLYKKGFVSRVECSSDRRIRTVSLTEKGREMFTPLFRRHAALIKRAFQDVSSEELQQLEAVLKKIGKRAESLAEQKAHSLDG